MADIHRCTPKKTNKIQLLDSKTGNRVTAVTILHSGRGMTLREGKMMRINQA
jgi:hypothetical protein